MHMVHHTSEYKVGYTKSFFHKNEKSIDFACLCQYLKKSHYLIQHPIFEITFKFQHCCEKLPYQIRKSGDFLIDQSGLCLAFCDFFGG